MKTNRIKLHLFTAVIMGILFSSTSVFAQYLQHTPTTKVVELSLRSLRESAQEIADYNQQLKIEISTLQQKIEDIRKESQFFENQQNKMDEALSNFFRDTKTSANQQKLSQDEIKRLTQKLSMLDEEYTALKKKAISKQEQGKEIHKDFIEVKNEITKMRHDLENFGYMQSSSLQENEQMDVLYSLKESVKRIEQLNQTYNKLSRVGNLDGSQEELLARKDTLQKQLALYKEESHTAEVQKKDLEDLLAQNKEKYADQISSVKTETQQLTERKQQLEETLTLARKQMKDRDVNLAKLQEQAHDIKQNIDLIQQQNNVLIQDYDSLLPRK